MNSVHSLPMKFISLVKMTRHHFFLLCFNFFSTVILSVFPFVFIDLISGSKLD
jgi:hypothetical protein